MERPRAIDNANQPVGNGLRHGMRERQERLLVFVDDRKQGDPVVAHRSNNDSDDRCELLELGSDPDSNLHSERDAFLSELSGPLLVGCEEPTKAHDERHAIDLFLPEGTPSPSVEPASLQRTALDEALMSTAAPPARSTSIERRRSLMARTPLAATILIASIATASVVDGQLWKRIATMIVSEALAPEAPAPEASPADPPKPPTSAAASQSRAPALPDMRPVVAGAERMAPIGRLGSGEGATSTRPGAPLVESARVEKTVLPKPEIPTQRALGRNIAAVDAPRRIDSDVAQRGNTPARPLPGMLPGIARVQPTLRPTIPTAEPLSAAANAGRSAAGPASTLPSSSLIAPVMRDPSSSSTPSAPPPAGSPASAVSTTGAETGEIQSVLGLFRTAFNALDAGAAQTVWPTVDARALERAFDGLDEQGLEFDTCQISVAGARAVAACGGSARYITKFGNKSPQTAARHWKFDLRKVDRQWLIEAVDAR